MAQARRPAGVMERRPRGPWSRLRWPVAFLGAVFVAGVAGYTAIEGWSFADSLYMTLLTLTSVGFKEVHPLSRAGQWFTIGLLVSGVALVVVTLSVAAQSVAQGGFGERARRRRMQRRIASMRDHFIVCAYGRVGRTVAHELRAEAVPFVVIDKQEELEEDMIEDGVTYLIDDPTSEEALGQAGIHRARCLVCAIDSDAENVFVTLMARSLNPNLFIVARAAQETSEDRLYRAGADRVVSPYVESGRHMALQALNPRVVDYMDMGERDELGLRVEELLIQPNSPLAGRTVDQVRGAALAVALRRADGVLVPNPPTDTRLASGDLLVLLGQVDELRAAERLQ